MKRKLLTVLGRNGNLTSFGRVTVTHSRFHLPISGMRIHLSTLAVSKHYLKVNDAIRHIKRKMGYITYRKDAQERMIYIYRECICDKEE